MTTLPIEGFETALYVSIERGATGMIFAASFLAARELLNSSQGKDGSQ